MALTPGLLLTSVALLRFHPYTHAFSENAFLCRRRSLVALSPPTATATNMVWAQVWEDLLQGGSQRWKINDMNVKRQSLARIEEYVAKKERPLKILCPLAGDDQFVQYAWSQGHDVTAIDLVPAAVDVMRRQFGGNFDDDWTKDETSSFAWKHNSGRATLYVGDVLQKRPELNGKFDAVYDKDAFGALTLDLRQSYCQRLAEYCKPGAIIYTEVKNKESGKEEGPPYHVEKSDLMEMSSFGTAFDHVKDLGEVYEISLPGMKQMGHILARK